MSDDVLDPAAAFLRPHPVPRLGVDRTQARHLGYSRRQYKTARAGWERIIDRHRQAGEGGPLPGLEPVVIAGIRQPAIQAGNTRLTRLLARRADPKIETARAALAKASRRVDKLESFPHQVVSYRGEHRSVVDARVRIQELSQRIAAEHRQGFGHHQRPGWAVRLVASWLPVADLAALIFIFMGIFNINYRRPAANPVGWLSAVVLPLFLVVVLVWLAHAVGVQWNRRREAVAEGHRVEAAAAVRALCGWGAAGLLVASVVAGLLLLRLWEMAHEAGLGLGWHLVLAGVALVVGVGVPLVKLAVTARDGSALSRERDGWARRVQRVARQRRREVRRTQRQLHTAQTALETYVLERPQLITDTETAPREAHQSLTLLHLLLGTPAPPSPATDVERVGVVSPYGLDLRPLQERDRAVQVLRAQAAEVQQRLKVAPT